MSDFNQQKREDVIQTWNKVSRIYDPIAYWANLGNLANFNVLLSHIGDLSQKRIVEVGCGSGLTSVAFAQRGATCALIDISRETLNVAVNSFVSSGLIEPECYETDALNSTVASDSFDVVWNIGVIEHFYDNGKKLLINEMLRMAKPGGLVIILVPNSWCWQFQLIQAWQKFRGTWLYGFEDDMSPRRLSRLCTEMGLSECVEALYAYDPIEGWYRFPKISRIVSFGFNKLEYHLKRSLMGFMSVLVLRK